MTPYPQPQAATALAPDVRLLAENRAENVALVRQALRGVAEVLALDEDLMVDINAAVSEACNNVVQHAYGGDLGPMEILICPNGGELEVVVGDEGQGIRPRTPQPGEVQGVGLSLIQAVTKRTEFIGGEGQGTRVRMVFEGATPLERISELERDTEAEISAEGAEVLLGVTSGPLVAPVLGRVATMLAARRGLSIELLSEVQMLADAIAAHAPVGMIGAQVQVGLETADSGLSFRLGPLEPGSADQVLESSALPGIPPVLERLATDVATVSRGTQEYLVLTIRAG
jgi:serine/threonine-protein kinase RsbW